MTREEILKEFKDCEKEGKIIPEDFFKEKFKEFTDTHGKAEDFYIDIFTEVLIFGTLQIAKEKAKEDLFHQLAMENLYKVHLDMLRRAFLRGFYLGYRFREEKVRWEVI